MVGDQVVAEFYPSRTAVVCTEQSSRVSTHRQVKPAVVRGIDNHVIGWPGRWKGAMKNPVPLFAGLTWFDDSIDSRLHRAGVIHTKFIGGHQHHIVTAGRDPSRHARNVDPIRKR